jgi:hypothetical protein
MEQSRVLGEKALNIKEILQALVNQFVNKLFHSGLPCGNSVLQ